jgi:tRNA 2-thiouridine synthesizing protein E
VGQQEENMPQVMNIAGNTLLLDKEGFLVNLDEWSEDVAFALARQQDIELTQAHWEILSIIRDFHSRRGLSPVMRTLVKLVEKECGPEKGNSLYLLSLFPEKPAQTASRIAGLPRPSNCI